MIQAAYENAVQVSAVRETVKKLFKIAICGMFIAFLTNKGLRSP